MPTIPYNDKGEKQQSYREIVWEGLIGGDEGQAINLANYPDKTVHIIGPTFDGAVTFKGSNDGTNYVTLSDQLGNAISRTSAGIKLVAENTLWVKPAVAAGTSENTIILIASKG